MSNHYPDSYSPPRFIGLYKGLLLKIPGKFTTTKTTDIIPPQKNNYRSQLRKPQNNFKMPDNPDPEASNLSTPMEIHDNTEISSPAGAVIKNILERSTFSDPLLDGQTLALVNAISATDRLLDSFLDSIEHKQDRDPKDLRADGITKDARRHARRIARMKGGGEDTGTSSASSSTSAGSVVEGSEDVSVEKHGKKSGKEVEMKALEKLADGIEELDIASESNAQVEENQEMSASGGDVVMREGGRESM
ncbi:hypothetical protein L873DRAFT_924391 [Choiromyces venosus 120613-1]|uniref:Uncharacterized protein n=1 Tax=Choiromyces venosus 120613-1 TaxID=1336337 RepID=A0A3N4JTC5_9PEZI|nr:hypothetical protein L873DRAFT_924391 [Choiromyces venosus 120613-1]